MEINIIDLEIGDEILVAASSQIRYLRILELPRLSKKRVSWYTKNPLYVDTLCSTRTKDHVITYKGWQGKMNTYTRKQYVCKPNNHNVKKRMNLNDRTLWLVKKNDGL